MAALRTPYKITNAGRKAAQDIVMVIHVGAPVIYKIMGGAAHDNVAETVYEPQGQEAMQTEKGQVVDLWFLSHDDHRKVRVSKPPERLSDLTRTRA